MASTSAAGPGLFAADSSVANFQVSRATFLKTSAALHSVCVGAAVFDDANRLLLVQRAASDSNPLRWEVPGGSVDAEDETILHGLARELWEETALQAGLVRRLAGSYTFLTRRGLSVCKYTFLVDVEGYDVRLNPDEHVAFLWVTEDEAKTKKCGDVDLVYTTKKQEDLILETFRIKREEVEG